MREAGRHPRQREQPEAAVAIALAALPTAKATISATSRPRRGSRAPKNAITGAPITTPSAYAEITWPPVGIETSTPSAIWGSSPIVTNSVVPIAKLPIARASTARTKWPAVRWVSRGDGAVVVMTEKNCFLAVVKVG